MPISLTHNLCIEQCYTMVVYKSEDMMHMPLDLLIANTLELFRECNGIPLDIDRNKSDLDNQRLLSARLRMPNKECFDPKKGRKG